MQNAALIALDWGTSNLRCSLLDAGGAVLDTRSAPGGIMAVKDGAFAAALLALCGDWIALASVPVIASGMIGSRQGWQEAAYLPCPAAIDEVAHRLNTVVIDGALPGPDGAARALHIVPGLTCTDEAGQADVMRGEETQLWGIEHADAGCCVLPGTHSKWAWLGGDGNGGGSVDRFRTFMTGELYGLLTQHSILGRLMAFGSTNDAAFEQGVELGLRGAKQLAHTIFAARTAGLMGRIAAEALPDFLSGILIGAEIGAAMGDRFSVPGYTTVMGRPDPLSLAGEGRGEGLSERATTVDAQTGPVTLIGDDALCARYAAAFALRGVPTRRADANTTTRGQWRMAQAAGLIKTAG
ncbi:MAG: 2-dehydro-3-deoxygalactonokinase [Variovorax sp.]